MYTAKTVSFVHLKLGSKTYSVIHQINQAIRHNRQSTKCSTYYIQSTSSRLSKYFWCFPISLISWIPSKILRNPSQILHITIPDLCWSKAFPIKSIVHSTMYAWSYQIFSKRKRRRRGYHTCSCWAMLVRRQGVWRTCAPAWSLVVAPGNACAWIWWLPSTWSSSGSRLPNKSDSMDMMQFAKPIEHSMDQGRTSSRHLSSRSVSSCRTIPSVGPV